MKYASGSIELIEIDEVFYLEAQESKKSSHEIITFLSGAAAIWLW